jgi:RpiB/LacA/LacB family sugar-phosphate isomerase
MQVMTSSTSVTGSEFSRRLSGFCHAASPRGSGGGVERGIAICGSGVGASVAANKVDGVRACLIHESFSAHQGVEDDNLNVMCLGGLVVGTPRMGAGSNISRRALQRRGAASPPSGQSGGIGE